MGYLQLVVKTSTVGTVSPGQGGTLIWKGRDARRKIWIRPLKETNLGVVRALFDPTKVPLETELPAAVLERSPRYETELERPAQIVTENGKKELYYYFFKYTIKFKITLAAKNTGILSWIL